MTTLQKRLFCLLEGRFSEHQSMSKSLEDLWNLDQSVVRRKINGDSKLSLDQLETLVNEYPFLVEEFLPPELRETTFLASSNQVLDFDSVSHYLKRVINAFKMAVAKNAKIKYVARDLPFFFFLSHPYLAAYKFLMHTKADIPKGLIKLSGEAWSLCQEAYELYLQIDSEEIWSQFLVLNQFHHITWLHQLGRISEGLKCELQALIKAQLMRYKNWGEKGRKEGRGHLDLFSTQFIAMNNGGILLEPGSKKMMTTLSNVNFISYIHPQLCENFERDFDAHKSTSTLISSSNSLERERYFEAMLQDIDRAC